MRWQSLFDDFEAQIERHELAEVESEVTERTRAERASVLLAERLLAHHGETLRLGFPGGSLSGRVVDVAPQWVVVNDGRGDVLVPTASVASVAGLGRATSMPPSQVMRRLGLAHALRALSRDRASVRIASVAGVFTGTIDRVGADHLDLAEHPVDELRRESAVRSVVALGFGGLLTVAAHRR